MSDESFAYGIEDAVRAEGPVTLLVTAPIDEKGREEVRAALKELIEASREEPGCLIYEVHESRTGEIVFYERWASGAVLARHQERSAVARFNGVALPYLAGDLRLARLEPM
ncbi:putative quinol monooxygenase [Catenuloplanes japonicus]|uniref:putative quinol monooxygenase n=1 Tax=Catenuloplanes japonicus TaxID=33876 RepID=UPI00068B440A|nr:putative quinol monooxygenase [Catenuloplanes japonicus]